MFWDFPKGGPLEILSFWDPFPSFGPCGGQSSFKSEGWFLFCMVASKFQGPWGFLISFCQLPGGSILLTFCKGGTLEP